MNQKNRWLRTQKLLLSEILCVVGLHGQFIMGEAKTHDRLAVLKSTTWCFQRATHYYGLAEIFHPVFLERAVSRKENSVSLFLFSVLQAMQHPLGFPGNQEMDSSGMVPVCHLNWHLCL